MKDSSLRLAHPAPVQDGKQLVSTMLKALEASLRLVEKADADSGCMAYMERAELHRAAIALAKAAIAQGEP